MTTIRISEPRELLALLPHQLGFVPVRSVVAVSLRGPRQAVGLVARVDLDLLADRGDGPRCARALVAHLARDGARAALVAVYCPSDPRPSARNPVHAAVRHLRRAAAGLLDDEPPVWVVTDHGYFRLGCDLECCAGPGRPLRDLQSTEIGARMVLAGSAVAARRDDLAAIADAPAQARKAVGRVRERWAARGARAVADGPTAVHRWRAGGLAAWRAEVSRVGAPDGTGPRSTGRLEAALADPRVRDAVMAAMVPGSGDLPDVLLVGPRVEEATSRQLARVLDAVWSPVQGEPPPDEAELYRQVLEGVVAHGRHGAQAPACTLLALLAWWSGEGARANLLLERALREDPGHRLALLMSQAVGGGLAPGWIRAAQEFEVAARPG